MSKSSHEKLIEKIKKVFELNSKKIEPKSRILQYFELDSLNQLKLMALIDENTKKKIYLSEIEKIKTFNDIIKLIND